MFTQAGGCVFCLHVWTVAFYLLPGWNKKGTAAKLELATPLHWFRWSRLKRPKASVVAECDALREQNEVYQDLISDLRKKIRTLRHERMTNGSGVAVKEVPSE
jgi:hypothetical protein